MTAVTLPDSGRVYAIGDIHGRADLLDRMVGLISGDLASDPAASSLVVTLGDYVDRGPDSRGVLDRLAGNPFPTAFLALKGNHEELFERFMHEPSIADGWRRLGGLATLHSYGVPVADLVIGKGYAYASEALRAAVPPEHLRFLASLAPSWRWNRYFFCHAGVRPGVALERQSPHDLLWIREPFLQSEADFGAVVVHGHTPQEKPALLPNRINVDTGAVITGRLTCVVLEAGRARIIST